MDKCEFVMLTGAIIAISGGISTIFNPLPIFTLITIFGVTIMSLTVLWEVLHG
jgi:hypothetical protein